MPTQGSCRPRVDTATASPSRVTDATGVRIELVGFTANRATTGCPVEMPPSTPPARLEPNATRPSAIVIASAFSSPVDAAAAKPAPISTPFTALMPISAAARSASSLPYNGAPSPGGTPTASSAITAPIEEPALRTRSRQSSHTGTMAASGQLNGLHPTSSQSQRAGSTPCGPSCASAPRMRTPGPSTRRATAPAATRVAVSRADDRPPPRGSRSPYFIS